MPRDRSHRETDGGEKHEHKWLASEQTCDKNDRADGEDHECEPATEFGEPALERSLRRLCAREQRRDTTQVRVHAGRDYQCNAATLGDQRAFEGHVPALRERQIRGQCVD